MARAGSPWGDSPPRKPKVGSGRAALAKRAKARGGRERSSSTEAARRAMDRKRGSGRRKRGDGILGKPVRGAWNEIVRHSKSVQKRFLVTQRMRNVALALAAIWVVWTFVLGDASVVRLWSVKRENARLDAHIEQIEVQQAELQKDVRALRSGSNPQLIEDLARDEHAMIKPGEKLVRFVPKKDE